MGEQNEKLTAEDVVFNIYRLWIAEQSGRVSEKDRNTGAVSEVENFCTQQVEYATTALRAELETYQATKGVPSVSEVFMDAVKPQSDAFSAEQFLYEKKYVSRYSTRDFGIPSKPDKSVRVETAAKAMEEFAAQKTASLREELVAVKKEKDGLFKVVNDLQSSNKGAMNDKIIFEKGFNAAKEATDKAMQQLSEVTRQRDEANVLLRQYVNFYSYGTAPQFEKRVNEFLSRQTSGETKPDCQHEWTGSITPQHCKKCGIYYDQCPPSICPGWNL